MPHIINTETSAGVGYQTTPSVDLLNADLGYAYPEERNWRPGSDLHERMLAAIQIRLYDSHAEMSRWFSSWKLIDNVLTPCVTAESKLALEKPGDGKSIDIVYPHSYAALDTMLSFLAAAFFNDPMLKYNPSGPADILPASLMEVLVNKWITRNRVALDLHTLFRHDLVYGLGIGIPKWLDANNDGRVNGLDAYGCALSTLNPYRIFPDPTCPIEKVATDGEFFGWIEQDNYYNLLDKERTSQERFNGRYLMATVGTFPTFLDGRDIVQRTYNTQRTIWVTPIFMKLIPKEFGLGDSEYPEMWFFEVANERVIIQARRLKTTRSMTFPIIVGADGYDGCSIKPASRLDAIQGLQTVVDWLITSHVREVRMAVNNRMIVDPTRIEVEDLASGKAFIRTKRSALGTDVRTAAMQLNIQDVTRAHLGDVNFMVGAMRDTIGTDTMTMGSLRDGGPERLTSQEADATSRGAANRFNRVLKILHMQVMMPLGEDFAQLTKERISTDFFVDLPPRYQPLFNGKSFAHVDGDVREMLGRVGLDVCVSYALNSSANEMSGLTELLKIVSSSPVLSSMYNVPMILERIFERFGVLDIANLRMNTMPDQQVQQGVQNGNLVPIR